MRHRVLSALCAPLAAAACLLLASTAALAQLSFVPVTTASTTSDLDDTLRRGQQLEGERRWGEALSHYEDALRRHPDAQNLERRAQVAKIHYDLARRYADSSFRETLGRMGHREALDLYGEVLLKIESHHVDGPNWKRLVESGATGFEVALDDPVFRDKNRLGASAKQIDEVRRELQASIASKAIRNRQEARDVVAAASLLGSQRLGVAPAAVVLEYICGATNALDEYSAYLTGDQLNDIYAQIEGNFVGLGVELKALDQTLTIVKVISGSPAERGGVRAGDQIIAVDGRATNKMSTDQAADLLQGEQGSVVDLTLASNGRSRSVRIRREQVDVPSIDDVRILDKDYGVGYFKLTCFQKTTSRDLDAALWKLHRAGMKSLVMDLRGNPGGLLTTSVEVVDKFVDQGVIVSTRGRNPQEDYSYSAHEVGTWRVPLVVLIDGDSASAAEIFAGAIRDHRRGTIVGSQSYGKGSVQGIFPLSLANAGVRLTTAKFYSPNGYPYSKVGVKPDVLIQKVAKPVANGTAAPQTPAADAVLAAGLDVARRQLAKR
ncbi:MAG: S41 family peptidase [Pirellulales bacterium]|jgi:carboxyl-terminal processing protease